jgi:hypothetical protein
MSEIYYSPPHILIAIAIVCAIVCFLNLKMSLSEEAIIYLSRVRPEHQEIHTEFYKEVGILLESPLKASDEEIKQTALDFLPGTLTDGKQSWSFKLARIPCYGK